MVCHEDINKMTIVFSAKILTLSWWPYQTTKNFTTEKSAPVAPGQYDTPVMDGVMNVRQTQPSRVKEPSKEKRQKTRAETLRSCITILVSMGWIQIENKTVQQQAKKNHRNFLVI